MHAHHVPPPPYCFSKSQLSQSLSLSLSLSSIMAMASLSFLSLPPLPKIRTNPNPNPTLSLLNNYNPSDSISSCRFVLGSRSLNRRRRNRGGVVCYAAAFRPQTLQCVSAVSTAVLMFTKGTTIQKSFLVPLFALQAPVTVISWIKGEYGVWTTFLALLVRLFYFIPGELDLPFLTMLLVIVAPYQAMNLRGSQAGLIISLVISAYLAFQHFSRAGSLRRSFDQVSVVPTLAIICITIVSCLFCF